VLPELHVVVGGTRLVIATHALAIVLGVMAGAALAVRRTRAPTPTLAAVTMVTMAAMAGARMLHAALDGGWGGLTSMGGIACGLAAAWIAPALVGLPRAVALDAIVPAGLLALGVGRIGCLLAGCCYGRPTTVPWGLVLPEVDAFPRHPLQLYSFAGDVAVVVLLGRPGAGAGVAAQRTCVGFGLLRTLLETLRDPGATDFLPGGWITLPQAASLILAGAASALPRRYFFAPRGRRSRSGGGVSGSFQ